MEMVTLLTLMSMLADGRKVPGFPVSKRGDLHATHGPSIPSGYLGGHGKHGDWET